MEINALLTERSLDSSLRLQPLGFIPGRHETSGDGLRIRLLLRLLRRRLTRKERINSIFVEQIVNSVVDPDP
jgi:hypothetical protein